MGKSLRRRGWLVPGVRKNTRSSPCGEGAGFPDRRLWPSSGEMGRSTHRWAWSVPRAMAHGRWGDSWGRQDGLLRGGETEHPVLSRGRLGVQKPKEPQARMEEKGGAGPDLAGRMAGGESTFCSEGRG